MLSRIVKVMMKINSSNGGNKERRKEGIWTKERMKIEVKIKVMNTFIM